MPDQDDIDLSKVTVAITFPKEVTSTHGLTEMMLALDSVELIAALWKQDDYHLVDDFFFDLERSPFPWPLLGPYHTLRYSKIYKQLGTVRLKSLSVNSPPDFQLITDLTWLAILIVVLVVGTGLEKYKTWRENAVLISQDAVQLARSIKGLSKKAREQLEKDITAFVSWVATYGEHVSLQTAAYFQQLQERLVSSETEQPQIAVLQADDHSPDEPDSGNLIS